MIKLAHKLLLSSYFALVEITLQDDKENSVFSAPGKDCVQIIVIELFCIGRYNFA